MNKVKSFKRASDVFPDKIDEYEYWLGKDGKVRAQSKTWGNNENRRIDNHPLKIRLSTNPRPHLSIGPIFTLNDAILDE